MIALVSTALVGCSSEPTVVGPASTEASTTVVNAATDEVGEPALPTTVSINTRVADPSPIEVVQTIRVVDYYGACGNETFDLNGVTWYPLAPVDLGGEQFDTERYEPPPITAAGHGLVRIVPPEEGDDSGTLYVYADGIGRFVSDSGSIDLWVTTVRQEYLFAC